MNTSTFSGENLYMMLFFQNGPIIEMADKLRDNGKIFVVVGVLLIVLLGILAYLVSLDRKISKLENKQ